MVEYLTGGGWDGGMGLLVALGLGLCLVMSLKGLLDDRVDPYSGRTSRWLAHEWAPQRPEGG